MVKTDDIKKYIVYNKSSVMDVLKAIDQNKEGIAFVVDDNLTLLGTISDGDIRRFILKGGDISLNCEEIMNPSYIYVEEYNYDEIKRLMAEYKIRHIPLLKDEKVLDKVCVSENSYAFNVIAVIMAGGEGKRLKTLTGDIPKPMVKIKEKTILEEIITNLESHNIKQIYLALNYKADVIKEYLKDGSEFGVDLKYIVESKKLGTAGALSLLHKDVFADAILVLNADVLTAINFESLIRYYKEHHLLMCIATKEYTVDIPFGVFDVTNGYLVGIKEKPSQKFFCNAGIYVLNREVLKFIPRDKKFDMTDLINILIQENLPVGVFPLFEYWIDIGNLNDFRTAKKEYDTAFKRRNYE